MCHFVTLVVRGSDTATIEQVLRKHGKRASPINNASIASALAAGEMQYLTTTGHCDCGTSLLPPAVHGEGKKIGKAAKLAKMGWSQAKIERWIADRAKAHDNAGRRYQANTPDSIELWLRIIGDLTSTPGVQQAGLLAHFYDAGVDTEVLKITRETVHLRQFNSLLLDFREDLLLMATA
jgi:hypothetical protein